MTHCHYTLSPLRWKASTIAWIQHGFVTGSEPHLKRAVLQCLKAITFSFSACAKVVRQDNEVLASSDSLQRCLISYVKQADPSYWLYWRACVSFWKLKFYLHAQEKICLGRDVLPLYFLWLQSGLVTLIIWCHQNKISFPLRTDLPPRLCFSLVEPQWADLRRWDCPPIQEMFLFRLLYGG